MVCVCTRYPLRARQTIPIPPCALGLSKSRLVPHKLIYQLFCFILSFCAGPPAEGKNAVYCLINASPQQQFFLLLFYVFKAVCRDSVYRMLLPYFYTRARGNYCEIFLLGFHFLSNTTISWVKRVDMNQIITLKMIKLTFSSKVMEERANGKNSLHYVDDINSFDERTDYRWFFFPVGDSV